MTQTAYIGVGANLGDREQTIINAICKLRALTGVQIEACSSLYETAPVGMLEQPAFLNMVVRVTSSLAPDVLLQQLLAIELTLGRKREIHWGPRTIDLDLLRVGDMIWQSDFLTLPHPFMMERAFVLVPLLDCIADEDEGLRFEVEHKLQLLEDRKGVAWWKTINWQDVFADFEN